MRDLIQKMAKYLDRHGDRLLTYTLEHIELILLSVAIAFLIACALTLLTRAVPLLKPVIGAVCNAIFAIPTLAMFAILIPVLGLGTRTAAATLVLYNLFILVKSIDQAFEGVDAGVVEAARGMGMGNARILVSVRLPLALPALLSGLKMSLIATLAMATLAANIGGGGLGILLFHGLAMKKWNQVVWGVVISLILGIAISSLMQALENAALRRARGEVRTGEKVRKESLSCTANIRTSSVRSGSGI